MTLIEVINAKNALKNYFSKVCSGETMFKVVKYVRYAEEQEKYYNEAYAQLVDKYGEKDAAGKLVKSDDGKGYKIKHEHAQSFLLASLELQNARVEYEPTLTLAELSPLEIKMGDMYHIFPIIKDE